MVRIADAHWAAHPDWVAPADAEDRVVEEPAPGAAIAMGPWAFGGVTFAEPRFTGVLAYLAEEQR